MKGYFLKNKLLKTLALLCLASPAIGFGIVKYTDSIKESKSNETPVETRITLRSVFGGATYNIGSLTTTPSKEQIVKSCAALLGNNKFFPNQVEVTTTPTTTQATLSVKTNASDYVIGGTDSTVTITYSIGLATLASVLGGSTTLNLTTAKSYSPYSTPTANDFVKITLKSYYTSLNLNQIDIVEDGTSNVPWVSTVDSYEVTLKVKTGSTIYTGADEKVRFNKARINILTLTETGNIDAGAFTAAVTDTETNRTKLQTGIKNGNPDMSSDWSNITPGMTLTYQSSSWKMTLFGNEKYISGTYPITCHTGNMIKMAAKLPINAQTSTYPTIESYKWLLNIKVLQFVLFINVSSISSFPVGTSKQVASTNAFAESYIEFTGGTTMTILNTSNSALGVTNIDGLKCDTGNAQTSASTVNFRPDFYTGTTGSKAWRLNVTYAWNAQSITRTDTANNFRWGNTSYKNVSSDNNLWTLHGLTLNLPSNVYNGNTYYDMVVTQPISI